MIRKNNKSRWTPAVLALILVLAGAATAQAGIPWVQAGTGEPEGEVDSKGGCCRCARQGRGPAGGRGGGHRAEMRNAHALVEDHQAIERSVEEIDGGVRTVTTSSDAELVSTLRQHVGEMKALIENGGRIRGWDPLFAAIFDHRQAIRVEIEEIENGVIVTETSDDPEVAALILAHARKVDDFVARGWPAYEEVTPLPGEEMSMARRGRGRGHCRQDGVGPQRNPDPSKSDDAGSSGSQ